MEDQGKTLKLHMKEIFLLNLKIPFDFNKLAFKLDENHLNHNRQN